MHIHVCTAIKSIILHVCLHVFVCLPVNHAQLQFSFIIILVRSADPG